MLANFSNSLFLSPTRLCPSRPAFIKHESSQHSTCCSFRNPFFLCVRIQWFRRVISNSLDDSKTFCPAFAEQYSITHGEVFWSLYETESNSCSIPCPDESPIYVDDGTRLRNRPDMKHCLVFGFDSGSMTEYQN